MTLLLILAVIVVMAITASRWGWKPVYVLLGAALLVGVAVGKEPSMTPVHMASGFWRMMQSIALIVLFGALLGNLLGSAGAMDSLAKRLFTGALRKKPSLGMGLSGLLVGIPVFCDAGYMVLSQLHRKSPYGKLKKIVMALMLALGLYLAHTLVPPTPGPMVVLASFDAMHLLPELLLIGLALALCILIICYLLLPLLMGRSKDLVDDTISEPQETVLETERTTSTKGAAFKALIPLLLPVVLISLGTVGGTTYFNVPKELLFFSRPWIALAIACLWTLIAFRSEIKAKLKDCVKETLVQVWPILLITGAGGAFGSVMVSIDLPALLPFEFGALAEQPLVLLLMAYLSAVFLKSAQGSSTAAIVVAASIIAPALGGLQLSDALTLALMLAIGTGALAVSHANDSFFWVIARFEGWSTKEGFTRWSLLTAVASGAGFLLLCLGYILLA